MPAATAKRATPYRVGALYLTLRNGIYQIVGTFDGKRVRETTRCSDLPSAKIAMDKLIYRLQGAWRDSSLKIDADWYSIARAICTRHRGSAKERGIPFSITPEDVYAAMQAAGFRCSLSGISFSKPGTNGDLGRDPWAASIDRIENRHGYSRDNIRVVCLIANIAMNQWGHDQLLRLSRAIVANAALPAPENRPRSRTKDDEAANDN